MLFAISIRNRTPASFALFSAISVSGPCFMWRIVSVSPLRPLNGMSNVVLLCSHFQDFCSPVTISEDFAPEFDPCSWHFRYLFCLLPFYLETVLLWVLLKFSSINVSEEAIVHSYATFKCMKLQ
jgi:hypothetical protein